MVRAVGMPMSRDLQTISARAHARRGAERPSGPFLVMTRSSVIVIALAAVLAPGCVHYAPRPTVASPAQHTLGPGDLIIVGTTVIAVREPTS